MRELDREREAVSDERMSWLARVLLSGLLMAVIPTASLAGEEAVAAPPAEPGAEAESEAEPEAEEAAEDDGGFAAWLAAFRAEAEAAGISKETLSALDATQPIARVIELDRRQPERRFTFQQYLDRVIPDSRVQMGRARFAEHKAILEEIGEKYGVQPRFLVALWGIETDYGRNTGGFRVVDALATLAHDGRRAAFFRSELLNALKIIDGGHITADGMQGSWAGALGQCQFMPSSFLSYAVDHTGDGRRDIWTSLPDVFASSANYLSRHGWQAGQTWGRRVRLPEGFDRDLVGLDTQKPLEEWQALGVRRADGGDLPTASFPGSIVQPGGQGGPAYLVYENYRVIMRWNRSQYFATAVGLLADRIGAP
jgi:membrane-bound lytic murein transglycosylase B